MTSLSCPQVDEAYRVFVIDFGVSRVSAPDPREKMTLIGTPSYMAPGTRSLLSSRLSSVGVVLT